MQRRVPLPKMHICALGKEKKKKEKKKEKRHGGKERIFIAVQTLFRGRCFLALAGVI